MNTDPTTPAPSGPVQLWRPFLKGERAEPGDKIAILLGGMREPYEWDWPHIEGAHQSYWRTTRTIADAGIAVQQITPTPPQPAPEASGAVCEWTMCDDAGLDLQCGGHTDTWPSNKYPFCPGCGRKVSLKQPD